MPITKLFFFAITAAGIAGFLASLPRLTFEEKKRAFFLAIGALPVVGLIAYVIASAMHHEQYQATAAMQALPEDTSGLFMLSCFFGLAASGILLWGASHMNGRRTYDQFQEARQAEIRAIERAKIASEEREQRMLEGRVQLARLEAQGHVLAIERDRARLQADDERAELERNEQAFLLAYKRYCLRVDPVNQKDENTLIDGFRGELGRRAIGRLDTKQLDRSGNALVQRVLHGQPTVRLTP